MLTWYLSDRCNQTRLRQQMIKMLKHTCKYLLPLMVLVCSCPFFSNGNVEDSVKNMKEYTNCRLIPRNSGILRQVKELIDNGNRLITFNINISGALGPLSGQYPGGLFNKQQWILVTEEAGKTLLLFPNDHVQKSFYTLSFGTEVVEMDLYQRPNGCFSENNTLDQILNTIRSYILRNISQSGGDETRTMEICNRKIFIKDDTKTANLNYLCCNGADGMCFILKPGIWLEMFDYFRIFLIVSVIAICPYFLPKYLHDKSSKYSYIATSDDLTNIIVHKYAPTETLPEYIYMSVTAALPMFQSYMNDLAFGTHCLRIKQIDISVYEDNLIKEGSCPVGILQFLYKKFIKCEMESENVVNNCCKSDVFEKCSILPEVPISSCVKMFTFILFFTIVTSPWWIILIYFSRLPFTSLSFLEAVSAADQSLNVSINNIFTIDYYLKEFSFSASYPALVVGLVFIGLIIGLIFYNFHIKMIFKILNSYLIHGRISLESVFSDFLSTLVMPFEKFGIFGFFICPFVAVYAFLWAIFKTIHPFKMCYSLGTVIYNFNVFFKDAKRCPVIALIVIYILVITFIFALISICIVFYTDCFTFVMVGLLLNYRDILRYFILILMVIAYWFDCLHSVNERYNNFLKLLKEKVQTKIVNQLETYELQSQDETTDGAAFAMAGQNDLRRFLPTDILFWKARRLVFFIDISGKIPSPSLSRKFFQDMNKSNNLACPGPEYVLFVKALRDFILVAMFLFFVIVGVFALGKAYNISSGVQTFVALSGGFLPFILGKVFKSNTAEITKNDNSLWEIMLEREMDNFEEIFTVKDIVVDCDLNNQDPILQNNDTYDFFVTDTGYERLFIYRRVTEQVLEE